MLRNYFPRGKSGKNSSSQADCPEYILPLIAKSLRYPTWLSPPPLHPPGNKQSKYKINLHFSKRKLFHVYQFLSEMYKLIQTYIIIFSSITIHELINELQFTTIYNINTVDKELVLMLHKMCLTIRMFTYHLIT